MTFVALPNLAGFSYPVSRTPMWRTKIQESESGKETRTSSWTYPRYKISIPIEFLRMDSNEWQQLVGFFHDRKGALDSWLFDDPDDNLAPYQVFAAADGVTTSFQLGRYLNLLNGSGYEPVQALNGQPLIYQNGGLANMAGNAGFEAQSNDGTLRPAGFIQYNNGAVSTSYTAPAGKSGTRAFGLHANAATTSTFGLVGSLSGANANALDGHQYFGAAAAGWQVGSTYTISFYAKKVSGGASWGGMGLNWNIPPASITANSNPTLSTSWQLYSFTFTWGASVETGGGFFATVVGNTASGDELAIDEFQIVPGSARAFWAATEQQWNWNAQTGVISFPNAPASASGSLGWAGKYYWWCRFADDQIDFEKFMNRLWSTRSLDFLTIK